MISKFKANSVQIVTLNRLICNDILEKYTLPDIKNSFGLPLEFYLVVYTPRYSTTDHWIQESIKPKSNSGMFCAVGAAEKINPNCHKYAAFEVFFLCFHGKKIIFKFFLNIVASTLKSYICSIEKKNGNCFILG